MPIHFHSVPESAREALESALPELLASEAVRAGLFHGEVGDVEHRYTLPVFDVGESALKEGRLLDDAILIGWRFPLFEGEAPVAYADLDANATEIVRITRGRFVELTEEGLAAARELEQVRRVDFHVAYLEVERLYFAALWLRSDEAPDLILPLEDHADGGVSAMTACSEAEILALLRRQKPFPALFPRPPRA